MAVNVQSVFRNLIICCFPVSSTGPTAVNELWHVCMARPAQMFSVWPVHPVYSLCAGGAILQLCVYFSYLPINRTHGSRMAQSMAERSLRTSAPQVGLFTEEAFSCGFYVPPLPMGGSRSESVFGRWCCTCVFHEAEQKGSSVLRRGNGRTPWKVWMEWLKK